MIPLLVVIQRNPRLSWAILLNAVFATRLTVEAQTTAAPTVREISLALMTTHVIPLETIGLLLTVALLGAVVLALPEVKGNGEQKGVAER